MSPDKSLQNLFSAALEREDPVERARFLDEACGTDVVLRERVGKLLRAQEEVGAFMAQPSRKPAGLGFDQSKRVDVPLTEKPGDKIGRYKLLQQIGEGGCGVVYMAEQEEPVRRRVALKVLKLGMDTKQVIARFEAERQALALMDHPNIARVFDAGATETGRPYFVMELVRGLKITEFCDDSNLATEDRLNLFIQVCHAIQHAHQKGIIHRDIKPSNILVTINDGVPVPKVIDFGIAKATAGRLTDNTLFTAFEQFIGTPAYMSPEQAVLTSLDIDTRSDIYSLGVLLYELLTGGPPFDQQELLAAGLDEMRRTIREKEPPRPSNRLSTLATDALTATALHRHTEPPKLIHLVRGDLDWIAMKCLEKDRARRYETANGLAMDIERHLNCEPVVARPPSRLYEFQKTVRRHKFGFAAAGAIIVALAMGLAVSTWQIVQKNRAYQRATEAEQEQSRQRQIAETKEKQSQQVAQFLKDMLASVEPSVALGRDATMLREVLDRTAERVGKDLKEQPEVEAELRHTIAEVYLAIGNYTKAEQHHREALAIRKRQFGPESLELAASLDGLARALLAPVLPINFEAMTERETRKLEEAEALARQAVAIRRSLLGTNHLDVAQALDTLGAVVDQRRRFDQAEAILREALSIKETLLGDEHLSIADSLSKMVSVLGHENKLDEAESAARQSLALRKKHLGDEHPLTVKSAAALARVLQAKSGDPRYKIQPGVDMSQSAVNARLAEAESLNRRVLEIQRKTLPEDHPDVTVTLARLGNILEYQHKYDEAVKFYGEVVARQQKRLGPNREVQRALGNLARSLEAQGNFAEAEAAWREELAGEKRLSGDQHPFVANSLLELSRILTKAGRLGEAELAIREAMEIRKKRLGDEHHLTKISVVWLCSSLQEQGKHGEAVRLLQEQLDHARAADGKGWAATNSELGLILHHYADALRDEQESKKARPVAEEAWTLYERHPDWPENERSHAYRVLDAVLTDFNDYVALEKLQRQMLVHQRARLSADDPQLASSLAQMTLHLLEQKKFTEAEATAREALTIREKVEPDVWTTFNSRSQLGGSLLGQKRYAEAEPLLLAGYEGMKQREAMIPAQGKVRIRETLQRLVQLYEATGEPDKAVEWNKKLAEFDQARAEK